MHVPQELLIKKRAPKFYCMRYPCKVFIFSIGVCISCTSWKVSEYGVVLEPYFALFGLNTEIYGVKLRIHSDRRKIRTRNNYVFEHFSHSFCIFHLFFWNLMSFELNVITMGVIFCISVLRLCSHFIKTICENRKPSS